MNKIFLFNLFMIPFLLLSCAAPQIGDPALTPEQCRNKCGAMELGFGGIIFTSEKSKLCLCEGKKNSSAEALKFLENAIGILKGAQGNK